MIICLDGWRSFIFHSNFLSVKRSRGHEKKINGIFILPLLIIAGCSSDAALKTSGSTVTPASQAPATVSSRSAIPASAAPSLASKPAPSTPSPVALTQPSLPSVSSTVSPTTTSSSQQNGLPQSGYGFDQWQTGPVGDVFFEFDSSALSANAQEQLAKNAAWFGRNTSKSARIEGHCDSRGTSEYNIALGERRSTTAKEYMVRLGVVSSRLESLSFGEERPFDSGKSNEAMAKNRRAHFIVQ